MPRIARARANAATAHTGIHCPHCGGDMTPNAAMATYTCGNCGKNFTKAFLEDYVPEKAKV